MGRATGKTKKIDDTEFDLNPLSQPAEEDGPTAHDPASERTVDRLAQASDISDSQSASPQADDGDTSPTTPTPATPSVLLDGEPVLGTQRRTIHFLVFVVLSAGMLVYAVVVAAVMWYILLVSDAAMESIVFVLAVQSTFLVAAVVWGVHAACVTSEPALSAYSFMLLMTVVLQFSLAMVVIVRGDEMLLFFESSALAAQKQLCADLGFAGAANATSLNSTAHASGFESATSELCACTDGATRCVMTYVDREYGLRPDQYTWAQLAVILVQLLLANLAWGMIRDLDYVREQKQKKQAGGPPQGILRGTIVSGQRLLDTSSKRGRDPMCVLELLTPDTAVKAHRVQTVKTQARTDTLTPQWDQEFDQLVAYKGSKSMKISLLDMSKRKKPVPMGNAVLSLDGQYLQRTGGLSEQMDGSSIIEVDLSFTETHKKRRKKAGTEQVPAGRVLLRLLYLPTGGSAEKVAKSLTTSWYFEATVLMMVGLSMTILALQSPTDPPSAALRGTLSLLEIFVATHMTVELALELFAQFAHGSLKTELRNPWQLLALYVCLCNWLAIFKPVQILQQSGGQGLAKLFSVSRIFRVVRPIRTLRMIRHIDIVTRILASQLGVLLTVCVLLLFLILLYALIGMSCFSGAIHYTCMDTALVRGELSGTADRVVSSDWPQGCTDACDVYLPHTLIAKGILRGVEPVKSGAALLSCPQSLQCAQESQTPASTSLGRCMRLGTGECFSKGFNNYTASVREMEACESLTVSPTVGNDAFGFQGFDNIVRAIVTMYVQMTGDGGMHAMPQALYTAGSGSEAAAWLIFFTASLCLNLVALNLFLAVCCNAYSSVAGELAEHEAMLAEKQRERDNLMRIDETAEEKLKREAEEAERAMSLEDRLEALDWHESTSRIPGCRNACKQVVRSRPFDLLISAVILLNTVTMAFNHHGINQDTARVLAMVETVFLALFFLELVLKLFGLGWKLYFMYPSNKFDFCVMFICLSGYIAMLFEDELVAAFGLENAEGGAGMQALRAVRLLRALQLARLLHKQRSFRVVLKTIFSAWKPICVHAGFCCFSVCMFSVIGMHTLGGSLGCRLSAADSPGGLCPEEQRVALYTCDDCRRALLGDYPYENYETFKTGVLASFELTVGEEWSHVMYWYMAHAGDELSLNTTIVQAFFVVQYLWMNCILFSLFTAMLLENFNIREEDKMPIQKRIWEARKRKELKIWRAGKDSLLMKTLDAEKRKAVTKHEETMSERLQHAAAVADLQDSANKSLYVFTLNHPFRLRCAAISEHKAFRNGILGLIVLSCVSLAIEGPRQGYMMQHFGTFFEALNAIVLIAFVLEAALKIIAQGLCFTSGPSKPYLMMNKNRIDFFVIVVCLVAYLPIVGELLQGGWAKALRLIRVMTPLISLTKNPEILLIVISFLRAVPDTLAVVLPLFLMVMVFGIIGQQWFGGVLGRCHSSCTVMPSRCTTSLTLPFEDSALVANGELAGLDSLESCVQAGATWESPMFNFDNSLSAVSLLFLAITDGVHGYMVDSVEAVPELSSMLFWIAFHVVFTCFFLNLFIGVLSASFSKSKGTATRTGRQVQWGAVAHNVAAFQPIVNVKEGSKPVVTTTCCRRPQPHWVFKWRILCYRAATNPMLENCWRLAIIVNTLTLATNQFPSNDAHQETVNYVNLVCLSILSVEVIVKLTGYGFRTYFGNGWLMSDCLLVTVSWVLRIGNVRSGVEILRVVRIFRLVALASRSPTLVALIGSLVSCLRTSLALIAICCVIIYFYCILGMNLFGSLDIDPQMGSYNSYNNFQNFLSSGALLVQIAFGQGIGGFVEDLTQMGVNFWLVFVYFATYYMVMLWICVNLLLVTVLDTFSDETADTDTDGVRLRDFQCFTKCWAALTIGVHMVPYCSKKESFVSQMAHKVTHPMETVWHAIDSGDADSSDDDFVPEDGELNLQGNLTITVKRVTGVQSDVMRPYCRVQLRGVDKQEFWTPDAETVDGTADFRDTASVLSPGAETNPTGYTVSMNMNAHHDTVHFSVHDNYQYMGDLIGAVKVLREEFETADKPITKQLQLQRRADASPINRDEAQTQDHWARFETDDAYLHEIIDEFEALDEASDDDTAVSSSKRSLKLRSAAVLSAQSLKVEGTNDEASTDTTDAQTATFERDLQDMSKEERKAHKKAERARMKAEKKRIKAEKKAKKAQLKKAKKEAKRRKKAGLPEQEEEDETRAAPSDDVVVREWTDSGVTLHVTINFERYELCTPRMGFLADYETSYAHKEANCGIEGWLECSEDGGPFKRRFVYLQDKGSVAKTGHNGAIKMVTNAEDGNSLAHVASASRLEILKVPTESIMNIYSDHVYRAGDDPHRKQPKNVSQIGCEFQIGVDLRNENTYAEKCVGHISGKVIGAENLMNVARGKGETSDPYCVLTLISTGMLAADSGKERQVHQTKTVTDDLNPTWNKEFAMDASVTTTKLLIEVYHDRLGTDPLIGTAEFDLITDAEDSAGPSSVWSSSAIVSHGGTSSVDFAGAGRTLVKVRLTPDQRRFKNKEAVSNSAPSGNGDLSAPTSSDAEGAGIVTVELRYTPTCSQHDVQYLAKIAKEIDAEYSNPRGKSKKEDAAKLAKLRESQLSVVAPKRVDYRFRALSPANQIAWVTAIRWLTLGCPEATRPKQIPHASLVPSELARASDDITLVDLPIGRLTRLIYGLYKRKAVGGHMPTRRWVAYTVFNIELHALANTKAGLKKKESRRTNANGVYLSDLRGVSFHRTLERLALLHLGKKKSLSYEQHAAEYELEVNSVSLHIIKATLQWWVNRKRLGTTQGGKKFPKLPLWSTNQALYLQASEAVCVARIRALRVLFAEVTKRKPVGYNEGVDQSTESQTHEKRKSRDSRGDPDGMQKADSIDIPRIEAVFQDLDSSKTGRLDEQQIRAGVQILFGPSIPDELEARMVDMVNPSRSGGVDLSQFIIGLNLIAQETRASDDGGTDSNSDLEDLDTDMVALQQRYVSDGD